MLNHINENEGIINFIFDNHYDTDSVLQDLDDIIMDDENMTMHDIQNKLKSNLFNICRDNKSYIQQFKTFIANNNRMYIF